MTSTRRTDGVRSTRPSRRAGGARHGRVRASETRQAIRTPGSRRRWHGGLLVGVVVVGSVCCSCSGPGVARSATSGHRSADGSTSLRMTRPARGAAESAVERQDVLRAWVAAERTVYRYNDEPSAPLRADILAGETSASLFPDLATYFTGAALDTVTNFLTALKVNMLRGPTSYNLGHPKVVDLTATTATVESCGYDSGTTTASGTPAPPNLDGGAGFGVIHAEMIITTGSWKISTFSTRSVSAC